MCGSMNVCVHMNSVCVCTCIHILKLQYNDNIIHILHNNKNKNALMWSYSIYDGCEEKLPMKDVIIRDK